MSELLLDRDSRQALAEFLKSRERPHGVDEHDWHGLIHAQRVRLDLRLLADLHRALGRQLLDVLDWPKIAER